MEQLESRDLLDGVPILHSYPQATNTIFLDFDGHVTTGTIWNRGRGVIYSPPFDVDGIVYENGDPSFSRDERARMVSIWERMAEDFRPFDVDITTEDPTAADPDIFQVGSRGQRIVFTSKLDSGIGGTGVRWFAGETLGEATNSWTHPRDTPAWVFSTHALAGELGSHEAGHALGLSHDGATSNGEWTEYQGEHGWGETRWSPIMGQGNNLSQWSDGDYPNATNQEQDIGILAQALGRRPDDYRMIAPLVAGSKSSVDREGMIGDAADIDTFSFEVVERARHVKLNIVPWTNGPNLDIGVVLAGPSGVIISHANTDANPPDRLSASVDVVLEPGTYYLQVDGVGKPTHAEEPGYSDYGSLGYYRISGSIGGAEAGDINLDGSLSAADIDALYAAQGDPATPQLDLNSDGVINPADVEALVTEILQTEFGDFDLNGRVDFADFLVLAANFGTGARDWSTGDATGDQFVDLADFTQLTRHFGSP